MVYQETSLVPTLNVMENIFLGCLPKKKNGLIDWPKAKKRTTELLSVMGVDIDPRTPVFQLPMWKRQVIEICKALSHEPKVLILDEPTSALARGEVQKLFAAIRRIREKGVAIIYISHKLAEVTEISDTVTVLRDGEFIGKKDTEDLTNAEMIRMMFGNVENRKMPADSKPSEEVIMSVKGLSRKGWFEDISFDLHRGEVLGIAGVLAGVCSWSFRGSDGRTGAQVDLLLDRKDGIVNLCEMKFSDGPYSIDKKEEEAVLRRLSVFRRETGTRKGVHVTFVTPDGLAEGHVELLHLDRRVVALGELAQMRHALLVEVRGIAEDDVVHA